MTSPESANSPRRPALIGLEGLLRVQLRYRDEPSRLLAGLTNPAIPFIWAAK